MALKPSTLPNLFPLQNMLCALCEMLTNSNPFQIKNFRNKYKYLLTVSI